MSYDYDALVASIAKNLTEAAEIREASRRTEAETGDDDGKGDSNGTDKKRRNGEGGGDGARQEYLPILQRAVDDMEQLSSHCPMTPLLWMMYADAAGRIVNAACSTATTAAAGGVENDGAEGGGGGGGEEDFPQTRLDVLELGLREFPGSALLHVHYCQVLYRVVVLADDRRESGGSPDGGCRDEKTLLLLSLLETRLQLALEEIGVSAEEDVVLALYRLQVRVLVLTLQQKRKGGAANDEGGAETAAVVNSLVESLVQRAQAQLSNHTFGQEVRELLESDDLSGDDILKDDAVLNERLEQGRRLSSKVFAELKVYQDSIDAALQTEGLLQARQEAHEYFISETDCLRWLVRHTEESSGEGDDEVIATGSEAAVDASNAARRLPRCGMGLGGIHTARAYIQYAQALQWYKPPARRDEDDEENDDDDDAAVLRRMQEKLQDPKLIISIYERGIADCPTVQALWLSYIKYLYNSSCQDGSHQHDSTAIEASTIVDNKDLLASVTRRASRNCPYSLELVQERVKAQLFLANQSPQHQQVIFDPDNLGEIVQEALDSKFLPGPQNFLALYESVISSIKRRILFVLSPSAEQQQQQCAYDDAESVEKHKNNGSIAISPQELQEAIDLVEDLLDLYDEVEAKLRKNFPSCPQCRSALWYERAQTEASLIRPILYHVGASAIKDNVDGEMNVNVVGALEYAEKAVRTYNPPHPDVYMSYIRLFANRPTTGAADVVKRLRQVRYLFEKAVNSVGKPKKQQQPSTGAVTVQRDYEVALAALCHEWNDFERLFGSERSLSLAVKATKKKLSKAIAAVSGPHGRKEQTIRDQLVPPTLEERNVSSIQDGSSGTASQPSSKRKHDDSDSEGPSKKTKLETEPHVSQIQETTPLPSCAAVKHVVRIGNLEYPAHPFTVRVSNLSSNTSDMDLVDAFRSKCGAVVHARILREKSRQQGGDGHIHVGKSKGWALVQFEERDSVEKALALNDVIGLHEKLLKIERSHMPAALLVPPGLHRIIERGHGKYSKRNEKKYHSKGLGKDGGESTAIDTSATAKPEQQESPSETGATKPQGSMGAAAILSFRPRAVGGRKSHQKPKISLEGGKSKK